MSNVFDLQKALNTVRIGGVIAYPTEGCYGLGCDPRNTHAIKRILSIKGRSWKQGLILIASDWSQLEAYVDPSYQDAIARARATWPGPYTWLLPTRSISRWIRGTHDTVALRISAHPLVVQLCGMLRSALISTSANVHGNPPARTSVQVNRMFSGKVDHILSGSLTGLDGPTEIRHGLTNEVIRSA